MKHHDTPCSTSEVRPHQALHDRLGKVNLCPFYDLWVVLPGSRREAVLHFFHVLGIGYVGFHFAGRVIQYSFACSGIYAARPRCAPSAEKGEGRDRGHLCKRQMTKVQPQRFGPWTCQAVRHPEHGRKTRDRNCPAVPPHDEIRTTDFN